MNKYSVTLADGTTVQNNISRKEARQVVASLKAEGKKARVVDQQPPAPSAAASVVEVEEAMPDGKVINSETAHPVGYGLLIDLTTLGTSVAVADLADALGMTVEDTVASVERLAEVGLPTTIPTAVARRAHQLYRDRIDGMLWRASCYPREPKQMTRAQAEAAIANPEVDQPEAPHAVATVRAPSKVGTARQTIFGHPTTRVVMWMGANKYTVEQATKVLAHFGVTSTPASIATFIRSGGKGDRGAVAPLTVEQAEQVATLLS